MQFGGVSWIYVFGDRPRRPRAKFPRQDVECRWRSGLCFEHMAVVTFCQPSRSGVRLSGLCNSSAPSKPTFSVVCPHHHARRTPRPHRQRLVSEPFRVRSSSRLWLTAVASRCGASSFPRCSMTNPDDMLEDIEARWLQDSVVTSQASRNP